MTPQDLGSELAKLRIDRAQKRPQRGGPGRWLALLVILGGAAGAVVYYRQAHAAVEVKVARPEREELTALGAEVLTAGGYVIPRHKIEVSSKIVGRVKEMSVQRGDRVKQGDVLLRIEDEEYVAQVRGAEAQAAMAKAKAAELRRGSRPQEIDAARAAVASAEATLRGARLDLDRANSLRADEFVSQQELDRLRTSFQVAQAQLNSARKNAEMVEIGPRREQIDAAEAQLRAAQANLEYARSQLDFTVLRAPIAGTILEKLAEKGELVTNTNFGGTRGAKSSVVSMANLDDLQVEIDLNENDLGKVRLRQPCEIRLDSAPDERFKGEVDEIAPSADRQKATVQVKVRILDPRGLVRPEVNARVTFLAGEGAKAGASADPKAGDRQPRIWIPRAALVRAPVGSLVYLASQGKAVARRVKTGADGPKGVEVLEGLDGSETLILAPLDKISDGRRIQVTP